MSLIIHMKIPGAIVAASDCRITGTESLFVSVQDQVTREDNKKVLNLGKPEDLILQKKQDNQTVQVPFGHYDYVKTDSEQKTFLFMNKEEKPFAISYCGNANLNGYPASYQIQLALRDIMDVQTTDDIAERFKRFWTEKNINQPPSLLISGYNNGKPSVFELRKDTSTFEHFDVESSFGLAYNGETEIAKALIGIGEYQYSLFRLQDAIEFCETLITTTAKIQSFQRRQQTVSGVYDLLVITEDKAEWIKRSTFELI